MPSHLGARTLLRQRLTLLMMAVALPVAAILPLLPALPASASSTPTLLGEQSWYTLDRHQLWDKADLAVNVASGDLIFHEKDLDIAGIGANNLILERYYNSLSNGAGGGADFGSDWVMSAGGDVKLTIVAGVSVTYQGPSSFQQVFPWDSVHSKWTTPAGMDADLAGPTGGIYTLTYHDNGQVLKFNSTGQLSSNADRNSNAITYAYNTDGTLHQITDATSRTVTFTYNGGGNVATMVDNSLGRTYTYAINGSHNLTGYSDPVTPVTTAVFTYDTGGKHELVDIKDPAGKGETVLHYDTNHRVTELDFVWDTTSDPYQRFYAYNSGTGTCTVSPAPAGNTVVTDELGHTTTYCWDSAGRVVQKIDAVGDTTTTVWNTDDKPSSIQDPRGYTTTYAYTDSFAPNENLTSVTQPAEPTVTGAKTTYSYGASTNHYAPTQVVNPDGTLDTYTYDANGNPSTMVNGLPSQNTVTEEYSSSGLLKNTLSAKGNVTTGCYDASSRAMTECYSYDSHGALTSKVTPVNSTGESWVNDAASRISTHTDLLGNVDTFYLDADDRVTKIAYGSTNTCPTPSVSCTILSYDADGNLQTLKDQTGTTTYTQDKLNRLASEAESLTGSQTCTTTPTACTTYTLDGVGNLKTLVNGAGTTYYYFDNANHPSSMKDPGGNTITFYVDADGNRYQTTYPNGTYMNSGYDNADHLSSISSTTATTVLTSLSYSYIGGTTDTNQRYYQVDSVGSNSWAYGYDQLQRLSQTIPPGSSSWQYSSFDPNSNNCGRTAGSACTGTGDPFQYNAKDQLLSQNGLSYTYWGDGSVNTWSNSADHGSLSPNVQGQLGTETHGSSISTTYTYRGVGQSDRATANSSYFGNQTWTSDLLGVSTELNTAQSACPCYYVHDPKGLLVEVIETTGTYYPVFDGVGSIIALTNSSGSVVDTMTYSPSMLTSSTGSVYEPWQFQGQYMDQTGGTQSNEAAGNEQYHQGARYREAGWMAGTWGQQDPLDSPFATQGWNRYNYAGQDPVNLSDPNGMFDLGQFLGGTFRMAEDLGIGFGALGTGAGLIWAGIAGIPATKGGSLVLVPMGIGSAAAGGYILGNDIADIISAF